jgi:hypothetical protein
LETLKPNSGDIRLLLEACLKTLLADYTQKSGEDVNLKLSDLVI